MFQYEYLRAETVEQACTMLAAHPDDSRLIAGGTDLMVQLRDKDKRWSNINYIIDCTAIKSLDFITEDENTIHIGPLTTHTQLERSPILQKYAFFLSKAASTVGSPQIRNRGTIGGSICNGSPAADPLTPLIALDATIKLQSPSGIREIAIKDNYIKANNFDLRAGEIAIEFSFKKLPACTKTAFEKLGRRKALAISRLNVSAAVTLDSAGKIAEARICPGCIFATPDRVSSAESLLIGKEPSEEIFLLAGKEVSAEMIRRTGIRWSTEYKQPAIEAMVQRALMHATGLESEEEVRA